ncbi:MAG: phosphatidate cytidylyltransferase [Bacteroidales bacterium]|jgi:phosphatidate cytidylyltransferase|nr:phosphatidate cytidylyltransferase [Bacteroidales bacterium]
MNEISKRTITGTIYIGIILAATLIHPILCGIIFGIISIIGLNEFYCNADLTGIKTNKIFGLIFGLILFSSIFFIVHKLSVYIIFISLLFLFIILLTIVFAELVKHTTTPFTNIAFTFLGILYIVIPLSLTIFIIYPDSFQPMNLLSLFIFAWCNDTFAYLTGCKWGKHRLCERISPKKSWEGFFGGMIATQIAAFAIWFFSDGSFSIRHWVIIGLIMTIFGTLGDLVESMFKRQIGIKDSGKILPGHGGILDRLDCMFIAVPVVFIFMLIEQILLK